MSLYSASLFEIAPVWQVRQPQNKFAQYGRNYTTSEEDTSRLEEVIFAPPWRKAESKKGCIKGEWPHEFYSVLRFIENSHAIVQVSFDDKKDIFLLHIAPTHCHSL